VSKKLTSIIKIPIFQNNADLLRSFLISLTKCRRFDVTGCDVKYMWSHHRKCWKIPSVITKWRPFWLIT